MDFQKLHPLIPESVYGLSKSFLDLPVSINKYVKDLETWSTVVPTIHVEHEELPDITCKVLQVRDFIDNKKDIIKSLQLQTDGLTSDPNDETNYIIMPEVHLSRFQEGLGGIFFSDPDIAGDLVSLFLSKNRNLLMMSPSLAGFRSVKKEKLLDEYTEIMQVLIKISTGGKGTHNGINITKAKKFYIEIIDESGQSFILADENPENFKRLNKRFIIKMLPKPEEGHWHSVKKLNSGSFYISDYPLVDMACSIESTRMKALIDCSTGQLIHPVKINLVLE